MSLELLYTSAASGLRQGSRGFCTVLSTSGMPANLGQRLEMLSGYRHVFSPQDAQAAKNPVCYSHVRIRLGGKSSSVLSRVAAYGTDYSGRTNKLAHHVVVEPQEQSPAGPAWLLKNADIMRREWDGQNQTPPTGPSIPQQEQTPRICQNWAAMTGDAGWGGYVADIINNASSKPLWLIYDLSQSQTLLSMLDESIALLPQSSRWSATFSTYYTNLPPEIDCHVRCVLAGTNEARLAAARGSVIDLTINTPLTAITPLVELARSGRQPSVTSVSVIHTPPASVTTPPVTDESMDFNRVSDDFKLVPASNRIDTPTLPREHAPPPPVPSKKKSHLVLAAIAIVLLLLASSAAVYGIQRYATAFLGPISAKSQVKSPVVVSVNSDEPKHKYILSEAQAESKSETPEQLIEPPDAASTLKVQESAIKAIGPAETDSKTPIQQTRNATTAENTSPPKEPEHNSKKQDGNDEHQHEKSVSSQDNKAIITQDTKPSVDESSRQEKPRKVLELRYSLKDDGGEHISGEMKVDRKQGEMGDPTSVKFDENSNFEPIKNGEKVYRPEFPSSFMFVRIQSVDPMTSITIGYDVSRAYIKKGKRNVFDKKCLDLLDELKLLAERKAFVSEWNTVSSAGFTDSIIDIKKKGYIDRCNAIHNAVLKIVPELTLEKMTNASVDQLSSYADELGVLLQNSESMPKTDPVISHRKEHLRLLIEVCREILLARSDLQSPQRLGSISIHFRGKPSVKRGKIDTDPGGADEILSIDPELVLVLETKVK